ncbi:MAG: endolytic transglycosylase MltG [Thermoleophilia bacterium]|nr:endolytic transglycosylase MltG [Thermoleophilia bacterium]
MRDPGGLAARAGGRRVSTRRPRPQRATPAGRTVLAVLISLAVVVALAVGGFIWLSGGSGGDGTASGPTSTSSTVDVLFIEGLRRSEMADILQEKTGIPASEYMQATDPSRRGQLLAGTKKPTSLEGFLFPATYPVDPSKPVKDLVDYQVSTYEQRTAGINYAAAKRKNLTKYDVLIIASLVERETSDPRERRLVAGVIENRLRARMRLDIDATV